MYQLAPILFYQTPYYFQSMFYTQNVPTILQMSVVFILYITTHMSPTHQYTNWKIPNKYAAKPLKTHCRILLLHKSCMSCGSTGCEVKRKFGTRPLQLETTLAAARVMLASVYLES